jgi:hypothetical protein
MSSGSTTSRADPPHPKLFFFLSFAGQSDADDERVTTFYRDLSDEIRVHAGIRDRSAQVGFLSLETLELGSHWHDELKTALGRCQVFVALCAPGYFDSDWCREEWRAFQDRLVRFKKQTGSEAPSLLPLRWVIDDMPDLAAGIQYTDRRLTPVANQLGLRELMRRRKTYDEDYLQYVGELARLIVARARDYPIPVLREVPRPRESMDSTPAEEPSPPRPFPRLIGP